jgi:hypothetical protein
VSAPFAELGIVPIKLRDSKALKGYVAECRLDVPPDAPFVAADRRRREIGLRQLEPLPHQRSDCGI